jgi:hypothetical protein
MLKNFKGTKEEFFKFYEDHLDMEKEKLKEKADMGDIRKAIEIICSKLTGSEIITAKDFVEFMEKMRIKFGY